MNVVTVQDATRSQTKAPSTIKKILLRSLTQLKLKNVEVDVTLVSDETMKKLNRKYRRKNKPTDVLSFSQKDMKVRNRKILGDIIIAKGTTKKQAKASGHPIMNEYAMLAVHGLLHLLDYDHEKKKDEVIMFRLQEKLLSHAKKD